MEIAEQPKLFFNGVDFIQVEFRSKAPRKKEMKIDIECDPAIILNPKRKDTFNVLMDLNIHSDCYFELSLKAIGRFKLSQEISEEIRSKFLNANAPAIMFPYVRSFVSTLTANLGNTIGHLLIPTQFFKGDIPVIEEPDNE
jgi:preprotein translocase subunit SecB